MNELIEQTLRIKRTWHQPLFGAGHVAFVVEIDDVERPGVYDTWAEAARVCDALREQARIEGQQEPGEAGL